MQQNSEFFIKSAINSFNKNNLSSANNFLHIVLNQNSDNYHVVFNLGISFIHVKNFEAASWVFNCITNSYPNDIRSLFNLGLIYSIQGNYELALQTFNIASQIDPNDIEILLNKACVFIDIKNFDEALFTLEKIIKIDPNYPAAWSNKGIALYHLGFFQESINAYKKVIQLTPDNSEAWSNMSLPLLKLTQFSDALHACEVALKLKPYFVEACSNMGNVLHQLKRYEDALKIYENALNFDPKFSKVHLNRAILLHELKRYKEALFDYDKYLTHNPNHAEAFSNRGNVLQELNRYKEALVDFDRALALNPYYAEAWFNKGNVLQVLKNYDEALMHYENAIKFKPEFSDAWFNKGFTLQALKRYEEALFSYNRSLSINSDTLLLSGQILHLMMTICDWSKFDQLLNLIINGLLNKKLTTSPFPILSLVDDPVIHHLSAQIYSQYKYPTNFALGSIPIRAPGLRIKVGYFSANFNHHAVGYLISELFELHDKCQFELVAFSFGPIVSDEIRKRLEISFDDFIDVGNRSDIEIAQLSRNLGIDIAVDLMGFTQDSRTEIFSHRAAPIQINYLGYPGSMGADYMDYVIADKVLIPTECQSFYSEKVVYFPNSYQVNDRKRLISNRQFTRKEFDLPDDKFVFCCFNNNYKILPELLTSWVRIMNHVENSIMWLIADNPSVKKNLKKQAQYYGIDPARLVFAQRISLSEHLARHRLADLFLDTFPYNAHTTASDALWAGLPILTRIGQSFPSRVAASLLHAIGMPELITNTQQEYEELAIELATNPEKLNAIKEKLAVNRSSMPLFDTPLFTKHLETAYLKMYERYQAGLEPDHIFLLP